jgi:hypothetical protein
VKRRICTKCGSKPKPNTTGFRHFLRGGYHVCDDCVPKKVKA